MFWNTIPDHNKLFRKYLAPWYPKNERPTMTRPDMYGIEGYKGNKLELSKLQYLNEIVLKDTEDAIAGMRKAYHEDFQNLVQFDKINVEVIDAIDNSLGKAEIKRIIKTSNPNKYENLYLVLVGEIGTAIGDLLVKTGHFKWLYSYPYFHSVVVNLDTGIAVTVYDWAVKKLSSYGVNDSIKAKVNMAVEIIEIELEKIGG